MATRPDPASREPLPSLSFVILILASLGLVVSSLYNYADPASDDTNILISD